MAQTTKKTAAKKAAPKTAAEVVHEDGSEAAPATMTVTVRGVEYVIPEDARDDFELLDDLGRADEGDTSRFPSILRRLLGPAQTRVALDSLRDSETGRVSVEAGTDFVLDLFRALNPSS
jgi:hypothetical protein